MVVLPPDLWTAFYDAKDALLEGLKASITGAEAPSIEPHVRSETLESIRVGIDELSASITSM